MLWIGSKYAILFHITQHIAAARLLQIIRFFKICKLEVAKLYKLKVVI